MRNSTHQRLLPAWAASIFIVALALSAMQGWTLRVPLGMLTTVPQRGGWLTQLLAFFLPGCVLGWVALRLRLTDGDEAATPARFGAVFWLLAAVAWLLLAFWKLDASVLDGDANQMHASLWMAWTLTVLVGGLARGLARRGHKRWLLIAASLIVFSLTWWGGAVLPVGAVQSVAFLGWCALFTLDTFSDGAASAPG